MSDYSVGHLFAGIDGFGLGLDAVGGYRTAFTAEWADFPHSILEQRVDGDVEHFRDVRELVDPPSVDVLTGGFPCQDLSLAGRGAGIHGSRSGLWTEYARIIEAVRPRVVLIENVPALLRRGFELVVDNLVELGYCVEWDCLPAAAFGAPHLRDRVFVVAHHAPAPSVYGEAVPALFADSWRELPTREDGWQTWPRAGYVSGEDLVELEPLAPLSAVRAGAQRVGIPRTSNEGTTLLDAVSEAEGIEWDTKLDKERRRNGDLWPTPQAADGSGGRIDRGALDEAAASGRPLSNLRRPSGARASLTLATAAEARRREEEANGPAAVSGQLNPDWVEWLMGFPIGWTNPAVANEELVAWAWHQGEPAGVPRTSSATLHRADRLRALGNALVPAAAAWLGARVLPLLSNG